MFKISELISKPVLSLGGASIIGTIINVHFDKSLKKIDFLQLLDDNEDGDFFRYLPIKQLLSIGDDAAVIKLPQPNFTWQDKLIDNNLINSEAFNQDGKRLGKVTDILIDSDYAIQTFLMGDAEFSKELLLSYSQNLLIINDSGKPIKLLKPKMRPPKEDDKNIRIGINFSAPKEDTPPDSQTTREPLSNNIGLPHKVFCPPTDTGVKSYSFLLGKRLSSSLFAGGGALIAKENELITDAVILKARECNKLVQLTLRAV